MFIAATFAFAAGASAHQAPPHPGWRLVQTGPLLNNTRWMSPEAVAQLPSTAGPMHGTPFMDVTDTQDVPKPRPARPAHVRQDVKGAVHKAHATIKMDEASENLAWLTGEASAIQNRKYTTQDGKTAAEWIRDKMDEYCLTYRHPTATCETALFDHTWTQPSTITRLVSTSNPSSKIVIVGGHEDSTASGNVSPGADDDGTGTVTVMEAFRSFLEAGNEFEGVIEWQTYAAEEAGLLGSAAIAQQYAREQRDVKSMLQFDMNGCCSASSGLRRGDAFNVCVDSAFTDTTLTARLQDYCREYGGGLSVGTFTYGYAASDHASFQRNGFPACHVKENVNYSPIHTSADVFSNIDFEYLEKFIRVALGFAIEESAPGSN